MQISLSSGPAAAWIGGLIGAAGLALAGPAAAQSPPTPPAPPSTGADVPQTYFGPPPTRSFSEGQQFLRGPQQLLRSGKISRDHKRITLPLYLGHGPSGRNVWYILTDTTDKANAAALGLNFSAKLAYAAGGAREATLGGRNASLTFASGSVNFSPERKVVRGKAPKFFPPAVARPGGVGDSGYSPYVRITNQPGTPIYNAPVVAEGVSAAQLQRYCKRAANHAVVADRVAHVCPMAESNGQGTVTLNATPVFSFGQPATYISTESSDPMVAALDSGTFAPRMGNIATGRDDSAFSAVERLFVTANGPRGRNNPQRQGLDSALSDTDKWGKALPPLQVIGGVPNNSNDYSPAWDLNLGFWTKKAISLGYRSRVIDEFQILSLVKDGWITGENGRPYGSIGVVVNCPVIERL